MECVPSRRSVRKMGSLQPRTQPIHCGSEAANVNRIRKKSRVSSASGGIARREREEETSCGSGKETPTDVDKVAKQRLTDRSPHFLSTLHGNIQKQLCEYI